MQVTSVTMPVAFRLSQARLHANLLAHAVLLSLMMTCGE